MPVSAAYRPDPAFSRLGPEFSDPVEPADFPTAIPRFWNDHAAATAGLDTLSPMEREAHFARFIPLPGQPRPLAMRYHGHQFGQYNPELGDGRGFLFAQLREAGSGRLLDLGTKGSGQTPYSRFGDGRLTLKGGVREVLATAMLEALGVPTSRSFALYETGEALGSRAFAERIGRWRDDGARETRFLIGAADGLDASERDAADLCLSFGALTWPHLLVRAMLAEQLWRATSILAGHPYHREG